MRAMFLLPILMLGCGDPGRLGEVYDVAQFEYVQIDDPRPTNQAFIVAYCYSGDTAIGGSCTADRNIVRDSRLFQDDQGDGWGCLFEGPWPAVLTALVVCVQQGEGP